MGARISRVEARLDAKPWGGTRLQEFGFAVSDGETIGEALITAGDAVVSAGYGEGQTLDAIAATDPELHLGSLGLQAVGGRAMFPLLAKIIDARQHLSIQVHPNDEVAGAVDKLGKTEAWYVLRADHEAPLFVGLNPPDELATFRQRAARLDGSSAESMRVVLAEPGQTVLIPAGTIHALGAGVMVYEIQQPSDITYRLDDWGRVDTDGRPREMHLDQGFAVSRPELQPAFSQQVVLSEAAPERQLLVACRYFALERIDGQPGDSRAVGVAHSPTVITVLSGVVQVEGHHVGAGESVVVWATSEPSHLVFEQAGHALISWVPDLVDDVVEPARVAGASDVHIAALAGETGDLATILPGP